MAHPTFRVMKSEWTKRKLLSHGLMYTSIFIRHMRAMLSGLFVAYFIMFIETMAQTFSSLIVCIAIKGKCYIYKTSKSNDEKNII